MPLSLIVAHAKNNVIGRNGKIPWYLPVDLKHFKKVTFGSPVIMGRHTFESLPGALPGRQNIVITRNPSYSAKGAITVHSLGEALDLVKDAPEAFIIGGGQIYKEAMPLVTTAYITQINADFDGDAYFEGFDPKDWELLEEERFPATDQHPFSFSFCRYGRK